MFGSRLIVSRRVARAGAALGALALVLAATPALASPANDAQVVGGEGFVSNGYVEVGSRANGSFGSTAAAPAQYHPRGPANRLGFRADRDKDGWGTGDDDGDFFTPGSPYEGWGIQVGDGGTTRWNHSSQTDIAGTYASPTVTAGAAKVTWTSTAPVDGLSVRQVNTVSSDSLYLDVDITLTNTTGSPMTNVYYVRAVDPDNCQTTPTPNSCDSDGDGAADASGVYDTRNEIVSQVRDGDAASVVSATQTDGSYIDLRSEAAGSLVATGTIGDFCTDPTGLADFYATPPVVAGCTTATVTGTDVFVDDVFYLLVKTPTLAAGGTRTFRLTYLLAASAAHAAPQTLPLPPTVEPVAMTSGAITLPATSSVGLPITYTSQTPPVCTVSGVALSLHKPGTCTVQAYQAGNGTYAPVTALLSFTVTAGGAGGGLPVTGPPAAAVAAAGAALITLGAVSLTLARRRRTRFQT